MSERNTLCLSIVFVFILTLFSCKTNDELNLTGNLTVTTGGATTYMGDDLDIFTVGLYDVSVLNSTFFSQAEAMYRGKFTKGMGYIIQFKNINRGNYVIAFVNTSKSGGPYKVVQVVNNATTIVDLLH